MRNISQWLGDFGNCKGSSTTHCSHAKTAQAIYVKNMQITASIIWKYKVHVGLLLLLIDSNDNDHDVDDVDDDHHYYHLFDRTNI